MHTRGRHNSATYLKIGSLTLAVAFALRGGIAMAQSDPAGDVAADAVAQGAGGIEEIFVTGDPFRILPNEDSGSSFGFSKSILETPRTVSFVSEEQIGLLGISTADDLARIVPGTYTNRRWGLQGGIDVRNTPADMYFRGMKRLNMQGHARTSLAGMDAIEVVKGPPSPIYGMGRIGGYTNLQPKLGRAVDGAILPAPQGFVQQIYGTWERTETSFGVGGPITPGEKQGGYYLYGLLEDSETWVERVHAEQKLIQGATSVDDAIGNFRFEIGMQYQNSNTAGAFVNRVTQNMIDNGTYIRGVPLVNLDTNGDGQVGYAETHLNSPVLGRPVSGNEPLAQDFDWPVDPSTGLPYAPGEFPVVAGIPQTLYNYLVAQCGGVTGTTAACADPTGLLRAQGVGGPVPASGQLPVGFALDPRTISYTNLDYQRAVYEKEQDAKLGLFFVDLINDVDENLTFKNQFFYDSLKSFKNSQLPYGENQDQWVVENKFTLTRRVPEEKLPGWLAVNMLGSINYRFTEAAIKSSGGDWDFRNDIMTSDGALIPNASFWNQIENSTYATGAPVTTDRESKYSEAGIGFLFDVDLFERTNFLVGARYDDGHAETTDFPRFAQTCTSSANCTSASPVVGRYLPAAIAEADDDATSWSVSISHKLPIGVVPYMTVASSSVTLAAANNTLTTGTINAPGGFIGDAEIEEFGIKSSVLNERLFITLAHYTQTRTDISDPDDPTEGADVTSSETSGVEFELKWVPSRDVFLSIFGLKQKSDYIFASNGSIQMDGRAMGFQDVVDPTTGQVIYPAEAFLYGGKISVDLPPELLEQYLRRNGNPEEQFGINASYQVTEKFGFSGGVTWFSEIPVTRVGIVSVPEVTTLNLGMTWDTPDWRFQINGSNLTDERYFRPRNGDGTYALMSSMPGRSWALTVKHDF
jgi:outer membrane receptor protein involved in Fe transport